MGSSTEWVVGCVVLSTRSKGAGMDWESRPAAWGGHSPLRPETTALGLHRPRVPDPDHGRTADPGLARNDAPASWPAGQPARRPVGRTLDFHRRGIPERLGLSKPGKVFGQTQLLSRLCDGPGRTCHRAALANHCQSSTSSESAGLCGSAHLLRRTPTEIASVPPMPMTAAQSKSVERR